MSNESQPGYSDIVISNFTAVAHPNASGSYGVVFESYQKGNHGKNVLRFVEVTESGSGSPDVIPGTADFIPTQQIGATYSGDGKDISLFFLGSKTKGDFYQKVRKDGTWTTTKALMTSSEDKLQAAPGSFIACTASGNGFDLFFVGVNNELTLATGPDSKGYWEHGSIDINNKALKAARGQPLVVSKGPIDTLICYTTKIDDAQFVKVICRKNGGGADDWKELSVIKNTMKGTTLAANLESSGATAGVFNVFYRRAGDESGSVSVVRRSREKTTDEVVSFSTTESASKFVALTWKYTCSCRTVPCNCSHPAQRFLAISKRDDIPTLFQYRKNNTGKWIIPCGVIITNEEFKL